MRPQDLSDEQRMAIAKHAYKQAQHDRRRAYLECWPMTFDRDRFLSALDVGGLDAIVLMVGYMKDPVHDLWCPHIVERVLAELGDGS